MSRKLEDFLPRDRIVRIYTCGLTVQGLPHIGHMRSFIARDILVRWLEHLGHEIMTVENFTDIDDKIIEKQKATSLDWRRLAEANIARYLNVCDRLNITRATHYPRASQHIEEIIDLVEQLVARGYAYEKNGDVYYRVRKFPDYGKLSKKTIDDLISGVRIDPSELKDDPLDFTLWKAAKTGEPYWHSPWGKGRPGWHIECSAMAMHYLGPQFDIHTGGEDLIFPHHENEIAQSEAASGQPLSKYWLHTGWVTLSGEKMSKSTGHYFLIEDVLKDFAPNVIRFYLVKTHYRSQIDFSKARLEEARSAYYRILTYVHGFAEVPATAEPLMLEEFTAAMNDDLNTPRALAVLFDLVNKGYEEKDPDPRIAASVKQYLRILGFTEDRPFEPFAGVMKIFRDIKARVRESDRPPLMESITRQTLDHMDRIADPDDMFDQMVDLLLDIRNVLRAARDFAFADFIRDRLAEQNIQVYDHESNRSTFRLEAK